MYKSVCFFILSLFFLLFIIYIGCPINTLGSGGSGKEDYSSDNEESIEPPDFTWNNSFYVDNESSGKNNGSSWEDAWQSFAGIDWAQIQPGDVLFISGGLKSKTYHETLEIGKGGTPEQPIYIAVGHDYGHHGGVIIDVQHKNNYGILFANSSYDYVTLDGSINGKIAFTITNAHSIGIAHPGAQGIIIKYVDVNHCGSSEFPSGSTDGIVLSGMSGCEIAYCNIWYNYQDAIQSPRTAGGWSSNKIHHNKLHNNGDDGMQFSGDCDVFENYIYANGIDGIYPGAHADGLQIHGSYVRVWNNEFRDNSNSHVYIDALGGDQKNIRIFNNIIYQTMDNSDCERGVELTVDNGASLLKDVIVANNTLVNLRFTAISFRVRDAAQQFRDIAVYNNVIYQCAWNSEGAIYGQSADYDHTNITIDYNLIYAGSQGKNTFDWQATIYTYQEFVDALMGQRNGTDCNPVLINVQDHDFRLSDGSPAINYGTPLTISDCPELSKDRNGKARPSGTEWDIGAYEY